MLLRKVLWLEGFPFPVHFQVLCSVGVLGFPLVVSAGQEECTRSHVGIMLHSLLVMDSEGWEFFANICAWIYKGKIRVPTTGCPEIGVT